jgi:hypothetical protein
MNLSSTVIGLIRTWVPIGVGALLTWLAVTLKIVVDPASEAALVTLCVAVLSAGYYLLVRLLEKVAPWTGILLGVPAQPAYAKPGEHEAA